MVGREQVLGPSRDPLHRPPEPAREPGDEDLFPVGATLHAESAADVGSDHANARFVEPEHARERGANPERRLRRGPHRQLAGVRVPAGERPAGLERDAAQALLLHGQRHVVGRLAESAVGIAVAPRNGERTVVATRLDHPRRSSRQGPVRVGDAAERLVVDHDALGRVRRNIGRLGDHRRDRDALSAHAAGRQQWILGDDRAGGQPHERHRPDQAEILGRDDRDDPRHSPGGARVERADARVGVGAPRQRHVQHAGDREVVDETSTPGHESPVFPTPHRTSNPSGRPGRGHHALSPAGR